MELKLSQSKLYTSSFTVSRDSCHGQKLSKPFSIDKLFYLDFINTNSNYKFTSMEVLYNIELTVFVQCSKSTEKLR